jgi:hypothetical protein
MKIKLLADYRGVLTGEAYYKAGEHEMPEKVAQALVKAGRATSVNEPEPAPKPKTTRTKRASKPKAK